MENGQYGAHQYAYHHHQQQQQHQQHGYMQQMGQYHGQQGYQHPGQHGHHSMHPSQMHSHVHPHQQHAQYSQHYPMQQPRQPEPMQQPLQPVTKRVNSTGSEGDRKQLDAAAQAFFPHDRARPSGSASSATGSAASGGGGRYVPPTSRGGAPAAHKISFTDAQKALLDKPLVGRITQLVQSSGTIENEECRQAFGRDIIFSTSSCVGFAPETATGERVRFRLSADKMATAASVELMQEERPLDQQRFLGVLEEWDGASRRGTIRATCDVPDLPEKVGFTAPEQRVAEGYELRQGAQVSFMLRSSAAAEARDVVVVPKGAAPDVAGPGAGQAPWELDIVFFHAACWDGLCSAFAFYNAAGSRRSSVEFIPVQSSGTGEGIPSVEGKNVAVVDVMFTADRTAQLVSEAKSCLIIDHHTSSQDALCNNSAVPQRCIRFDNAHSAAAISWEFCRKALEENPNRKSGCIVGPIPLFMSLVGEVDLGRFGLEHPLSRKWAIGVELFARHRLFSSFDTLMLGGLRGPQDTKAARAALSALNAYIKGGDSVVRRVLDVGEEAEVALEEQVREWMANHELRRMRKRPDLKVAVVFVNQKDSLEPLKSPKRPVPFKFARNELGHRLSRLEGVFCGVVVAGKAVMLRTDKAGPFSVADLAQLYGGGGHATAAAFQLETAEDVDDPYSTPFLPLDSELTDVIHVQQPKKVALKAPAWADDDSDDDLPPPPS